MTKERGERSFGAWFRNESYRWQRQLAAYMLVAMTFLFLVTAQHNNSLGDCRDRRDARQAVRGLVLIATSQSPPDYSQFPSYKDLDEPTKRFLTEVQQASANGTLGDFRDQALAALPPLEC